MRPRIILQFRTRHTQQGSKLRALPVRQALPLGHRRQAFGACATQQLQQQGFGLVVLMVCGEQKIRVQRRKNMAALTPGGRFDARRIIAAICT